MKLFLTAFILPILSVSAEPTRSVVDLLPEKLLDATGKKIDATVLRGKYIGLYFSAHWCAPCRAFTPALVEFRNRHVEDGFEIVFVSLDKSNMEKQKYIRSAGMKWPSVKGADNRATNSLARDFGIEAYPALVILDPTGKIVTSDGTSDVKLLPETALKSWKGEESS